MKKGKFTIRFTVVAAILLSAFLTKAVNYKVTSPNSLLQIKVDVDSVVRYEVTFNGAQIITPSAISLNLNTGLTLGKKGTVKNTETSSVNETITPLFGKNKEIKNIFNELRINFTENYSLILRAYDEGAAYRFETALGGSVIVNSEEANFNFAGSPKVIFPEADATMRSWERTYTTYASIQDIDQAKFSITPTLFSYSQTGVQVLIAESDLSDYPGMYLQRNANSGVKGKWAQYPKTVSEPTNMYAYHRVTERYDYLARTSGSRSYPWRIVIVAKEDKDLLNNELIYKLARPQALTNTSWITPGKSTWEWWHDAILEGVDIPSGISNLGYQLYKYYVDFAAENKLEYLTMDAGWSADYVAQVCSYAASRNVKIFLWDYVNLPIEDPNRLTQLKSYGAAGVKIDLIERDDQIAINWIEKIAKDCADRQLMVIFHGCPKPTGLQKMYPNVLNFEAVRGEECDKWDKTSNADYHLLLPFIRMLSGPMEYTPGSMRNLHIDKFYPIPQGIPSSIGTRCHELAMYVVFDQPLAYLSDSPPAYRKYPDILSFLSHVPSVWEQTVPLSAKVGEYAVMARKKGEEWYAGAMTNSTGRDVDIDFSFLDGDITWTAEVYRDNGMTDSDAKEYTHEIVKVTKTTKLKYRLSPEGGLAMRIYKEIATGLDKDIVPAKILVYPDPVLNQLVIKSGENIKSISIFDLTGKIRYLGAPRNQGYSATIDISGFTKGIYIAKVITSGKAQFFKFLK